MSAPENSTAIVKSAPDHHQNVVPAATSSSATPVPTSSAAAAAAPTGTPTGSAGAPTVAAAVPATGATPTGAIVPGTSAPTALSEPVAPISSGAGCSANGSNNSNSGSESHCNTGEEAAESSVKNTTPCVAAGGGNSGDILSVGGDGEHTTVPPVDATNAEEPDGTEVESGAPGPTGSQGTACDTPLSSASPASLSANEAGSLCSLGTGALVDATTASTSVLVVPSECTGDAGELTASTLPVAQSISACSSSSSLESVAGHVTPSVSNGASGADDAIAGPSNLLGRGRDAADKPHHSLEYHCRMLEEELQSVKESEAKLKQQYIESQRRERFLVRRLAVKDQEMQDYANQIAELKSAQAPGPAALRSALLDPAINILFQKLKAELQATKAKLEETQNELSAWKFTPDSNTGKRLMAKCRLLYQENEELGKMTSNGRLAKLENELALQKGYNEEVKKSQLELDDFLQELDEDVEGMQSTIVFLQQELKQTKDSRDELEKELTQLRAYVHASSPGAHLAGGSTPTEENAMLLDGQDTRCGSTGNSSIGGVYHRPEGGGGADSIGGGGSMGGGITPIYLVNGGGSGTSGATASRLVVNKSSSSSGDQDMVYNNRTHCGGVGNSVELRTTPPTGAGSSVASSNSGHAGLLSTASSLAAAASGTPAASPAAVNGGGVATVTDDTVAAGDDGEALGNELTNEPPVGGGDGNAGYLGGRTSGGNTINSVNSANNNTKQQRQQQQISQHHDPHQRVSSNNGGRNGGRTTVAARKRNYNDTEADSPAELPAESGGSNSSVGGGAGESGTVHLVDGQVTTDSGAVENGKLTLGATMLDGTGPTLDQQQDAVESNSAGGNKRMTRSGKGKAASTSSAALVTGTPTTAGSSSSSSSSSTIICSATNALITSAAKKLRRGSVTIEEEVDPLVDTSQQQQQQQQQLQQPQQQQQQHLHHTQQTISSANGSN